MRLFGICGFKFLFRISISQKFAICLSPFMVDVKTEIEIDCEVETVSGYACNPDNATAWYKNIKSLEWKTPKPLSIGSQIDFKAQFLGRELAYTYEIIELDPPHKMVMRTADGPFPMETTYTWEAVGNGQTRMALRNRGIPSGFSKWFAPIMAIMMRKANQKDLKLIKYLLESNEPTNPK